MRAFLTFLALLVLPIPVLAHEHWISRQQFRDPVSGAWCCNEHDCKVLDLRQIRETAGGFLIGGMYFVTRERVLPSSDESYWACFTNGGTGAHEHQPGIRCLFVPLST